MSRLYRSGRLPSGKPAVKGNSDALNDRRVRDLEVSLLRRQSIASVASVCSTALLSLALLLLTFCQWQTAESTAAIERAKSRPHFRIRQTDQRNTRGFLPREFVIEGDRGVSDAVEATAASVMLIHYSSRELGLSGICRARFSNFYAWGNDAMSFEISDAAERLLSLSRHWGTGAESAISLQPLWVVVGVDFIDIFGEAGHQDVQVFAGQIQPLDRRAQAGLSQAGIDFNVQLDPSGNVQIYRVSTEPAATDCVDALRVMDRLPTLRIARQYAVAHDRAYIITTDRSFVRDRGRPISSTYPAPTILPSSQSGERPSAQSE